jgi:hypothetical protein
VPFGWQANLLKGALHRFVRGAGVNRLCRVCQRYQRKVPPVRSGLAPAHRCAQCGCESQSCRGSAILIPLYAFAVDGSCLTEYEDPCEWGPPSAASLQIASAGGGGTGGCYDDTSQGARIPWEAAHSAVLLLHQLAPSLRSAATQLCCQRFPRNAVSPSQWTAVPSE